MSSPKCDCCKVIVTGFFQWNNVYNKFPQGLCPRCVVLFNTMTQENKEGKEEGKLFFVETHMQREKAIEHIKMSPPGKRKVIYNLHANMLTYMIARTPFQLIFHYMKNPPRNESKHREFDEYRPSNWLPPIPPSMTAREVFAEANHLRTHVPDLLKLIANKKLIQMSNIGYDPAVRAHGVIHPPQPLHVGIFWFLQIWETDELIGKKYLGRDLLIDLKYYDI